MRCPRPRLAFIGGGSGIASLGPALVRRRLYSYHLITAFDSGGSSGSLRRYLGVAPPGDLRNRLLALADREFPGVWPLVDLLDRRLPSDSIQAQEMYQGLLEQILSFQGGEFEIVRGLFSAFETRARGFPLAGSCMGNLALVGGVYLFGSLRASGALLAGLLRTPAAFSLVTEELGDLVVRLPGQGLIVGQDRLTKICLASLEEIFLVGPLGERIEPPLCPQAARFLSEADLIVIGPGSFFTSLVACFLVSGLKEALSSSCVPVVLVPGSPRDPERLGLGPRLLYEIWSHFSGDIVDVILFDNTWPREKISGPKAFWLDIPQEAGRYQGEFLLEALLTIYKEVFDGS
ncbi:2-phospho-L-lactate transferase CofD family protein [Thermosulfuriphilus sp.]